MKEKPRSSRRITSADERTDAIIKKHKKFTRWKSTVVVLAIAVLLSSGYSMILPATTMSQQAYCGLEEHVHTDACYEQRLICTEEESHEHEEECYSDVQTCICDLEESEEGHTHSEECYETTKELSCTVDDSAEAHKHADSCYEKVLVCELGEHTHSLECYSNTEADVESPAVWERSVSDIKLTGIWADDLVEVAESQLGYKESKNNYIVDADGNLKGYTRYGAWYGNTYADWSGMFVSFCMNYAEISEEEMPRESSSADWAKVLDERGLYETTDDCVPQKGDLVFFSSTEDADEPDNVGIIAEVTNDKDGNLEKLQVIEGDAENEVVKTTYEANNSRIVGYGVLPQNPDGVMPEETTEKAPAKAKANASTLAGNASTLATGDTYVGYSKLNSAMNGIDWAYFASGVGVRKFYIVKKSIYERYMLNMTYSSQQNIINNSELAYCFNYYKEAPTNTFSNNHLSLYSEAENASPSLFLANTSSHRRYSNANMLYNKVMAMVLNGYPNDYSGIKAKYGLTNDEFRAITQYAVWYYTDNISIKFSNSGGVRYFHMFADDTGAWLSKNSSGVNIEYPYYNDNLRLAYNELVESSLDVSTLTTSHINLFKNTNKYTNGEIVYQHLLTVGREDAPPPQNNLTIEKTVTGTAGDTNEQFTFTIQLRNQNKALISNTTLSVTSSAISGVAVPTYTSIKTDVYGKVTVTLKHGQSITINGLPNRFYYSVTENEANQNGYETTVDGADSNMTTTYGTSGNVEVGFINHKDSPPPQNSLKIGKTVTGTGGDTDKLFNFTIQLRKSNWSYLTGTFNVTPGAISGVVAPTITQITFNSQGEATFTLKHGQYVTIEGLPDGFYYTVTEIEANSDGYTTSVVGKNNSNMSSYSGATGAVEVEFTNHKDAPVLPTAKAKVQIPVRKTIDGGQTPIGDNRFTFRLTGNGQDLTAVSDEKGEALFPEIIYTKAGTYTYTVEEVTDARDGNAFNFDKDKKTVTVTVSSHDVQTYDEQATYYAFEKNDYDNYYYVDTTPGGEGIVMYCTNADKKGPQYTSTVQASKQTYKAVINPTVAEIIANKWVYTKSDGTNDNGDALVNNLKKLFYYFETDEGSQIANNDKQSLVWSATDGRTRTIDSISVNGNTASGYTTTLLNNIYQTVTTPPLYNLAFFVPTGTQATKYPQPLATGYGAVVETTSNGVVFNNTTIPQNSLKLTKTVTGVGDTEKEFEFLITLKNQWGSSLTGTYPVISSAIDGVEPPDISQITITASSAGVVTVHLKHGQSIEITGLPSNFEYSIIETNADEYEASVSENGDPANKRGVTGTANVEFINHKDAPPTPPSYETEIKVNKTLNGGLPEDGQFTFILRDANGTELARKNNDANGEVSFPLTFTNPGEYVYTVEEYNDGQDGIVYDTTVKRVTIRVTSETIAEVINEGSFEGSGTPGNFKITVTHSDGSTKVLPVYCIDGSAGYPRGSYDKVLNPTSAQLAEQVTANNYGNALADNMRKLLYYFDTHSYADVVTGDNDNSITLTKSGRQELIWCLTGNPGEQHISYRDPLAKILEESNPPSSYDVVMFAPTEGGQPVIAGYLPGMTVIFEGNSGDVEFANYYEYVLPETGGRGTTGYTLGGMLLLCGAVVLMYIKKLERRKGGNC